MQPKVSVLVPVYNVARYLPECLDSAARQTLKEIEFICVNDGSTDNSLEILREYEANYPTIKVIDKENGGYGIGMNTALDAATGEYVGILESDDFASKDMFEMLYRVAKAADADAVKSQYFTYVSVPEPSEGRVESLKGCPFGKVFCPREDDQTIFYAPPSIWAGLYKRQFLLENGIRFTETPGASFQDTSFNFKVWAAADRVVAIEDAFLHYRIDNEGSSVKSREKVSYVNREYAEMRAFLDHNPRLRANLVPLLNGMKFKTYTWNLKRLAPGLRYEYYQTVVDEFKAAQAAGEIREDMFAKAADYNAVAQMLKDPDRYFAKEFRPPTVKHTVFVCCDDLAEGLGKTLSSITVQSEKSYEVIVLAQCPSRDIEVCVTRSAADGVAFKLLSAKDCFAGSLDASIANGEFVTFMHCGQLLRKDALSKISESCKKGSPVYGVFEGSEKSAGELEAPTVLARYYATKGARLPFVAGPKQVFADKPISFPYVERGAVLFGLPPMRPCAILRKLGENEKLVQANMIRPLPQAAQYVKYYAEIKAAHTACAEEASKLGLAEEFDAFSKSKASWMHDYLRSLPLPMRDEMIDVCNPKELSPSVLRESLKRDVGLGDVSVTVIVADGLGVDSPELTIRSVLEQRVDGLQAVYLGSQGANALTFLEEATSDERFSYTVLSDCSGDGVAFNQGLDEAKGTYVCFMHSNCRFSSNDALASLLSAAESSKAVVVSGCVEFCNPVSPHAIRFMRDDVPWFFEKETDVAFADYQFPYGIDRYLFNTDFLRASGVRFEGRCCMDEPVFVARTLNAAESFKAVPAAKVCYAENAHLVPLETTEQQSRDTVLAIGDLLQLSKEAGLDKLHADTYRSIKEDYNARVAKCIEYRSVFNALLYANEKLNPMLLDGTDVIHVSNQVIPALQQASDLVASGRTGRSLYTALKKKYDKLRDQKVLSLREHGKRVAVRKAKGAVKRVVHVLPARK